MKKVLIFKMEEIAYSSTRVFADKFGEALENLGVPVQYFDMQKNTVEELEELEQEEFLAAIDFNSRLPGAVQDEKEYFLDKLNAPFYNYILDHPIYHHNSLEKPLQNFNVICIDNDHAEYVREWYPHIKSVHTMPLGAILVKPESKRYDLLFSATYLNPKEYMEVIKELPTMMKQPVFDTIDILLADPSCTFEAAVYQVYQNNDELIDFPIYARANFLADIYVRAYFREEVLKAAVKSGVSVAVCGEKYQESEFASYNNVTMLGEYSYLDSISVLAASKAVLNVMPWFKDGLHDRILNAMINGTVCVTDTSIMLEKNFCGGQDYVGYSLKDIHRLKELLPDLLGGKSNSFGYNCEQIAKSARHKAAHMTFKDRAEEFLTWL